jgi:hypothetical protein
MVMRTLIFQLYIKQWDKGERSAENVEMRDNIDCFAPICEKPEFYILGQPCIIDRPVIKGLSSINDRPVNKALFKDGRIQLENFIIHKDNAGIYLTYAEKDKPAVHVGNLSDGWIQARYQWRYAVERNEQIFWQYEEITLNAAWAEHYTKEYFVEKEPFLIMNIETPNVG